MNFSKEVFPLANFPVQGQIFLGNSDFFVEILDIKAEIGGFDCVDD